MQKQYFEDFSVGDTFDLGSYSITEEEIINFGRQFDPQPYHISPEQAKHTFFGGLVASGWHTTAIYMRLLVDTLFSEAKMMGSPGVEDIRWLRPVRPGDTLHGRFTVTACSPSKSRADRGTLHSLCEMFNQAGELVMSVKGIHFVARRPDHGI